MTETLTEIREFYWANRDVMRIAAGAAVVLLTQTVLVVWALRRLRELGHLRERLSRLADGLALLTDTTDAGLTALIREVERLNARRVPAPAPAKKSARAQTRRAPAPRPNAVHAGVAPERDQAPTRLQSGLADALMRSAQPVIQAGSEDPALLRI
jgi:hypothetical protein